MYRISGLATVAAAAICVAVSGGAAQAVFIDNGFAGDGRWQVDVEGGGETRLGNLDPTGAQGLTDVIFDYFTTSRSAEAAVSACRA
jgi:hypothetical protein